MTKTVTIQAQQRWDYCFETRKTENALLTVLTEFGQHGWDVINVLHYKDMRGDPAWTAFLKRPSAGQAPASRPQTADATKSTLPPDKTTQSPGFDLSGDEFQLKATHGDPQEQKPPVA